jgi:hypothetical protein
MVTTGPLTVRGRPRSLVGAYLIVIAAQDRVLKRLLALHQQRHDEQRPAPAPRLSLHLLVWSTTGALSRVVYRCRRGCL